MFALLNLLRLTGRFLVRLCGRRLWPVLLAGLFEPVLYFPLRAVWLKLTSTSFSGVMVALIPLCSLVYGAVFLHEGHAAAGRVLGPLRRGVIVLAVYATGIGAGSFPGFLCPARHSLCRCGLYGSLPRVLGQFTAFERTYITCGTGRPLRSGCCPCSSTGTTCVPSCCR